MGTLITFNLGKDTQISSFLVQQAPFKCTSQACWQLNHFFHKMTPQIICSYPISSQLCAQPNPFIKFSWKYFTFVLCLYGKVFVAGMATRLPLCQKLLPCLIVPVPANPRFSAGQGWDHQWQWWHLQLKGERKDLHTRKCRKTGVRICERNNRYQGQWRRRRRRCSRCQSRDPPTSCGEDHSEMSSQGFYLWNMKTRLSLCYPGAEECWTSQAILSLLEACAMYTHTSRFH